MRVIIAGPPCAGKSSLAKRIAAQIGGVVIDFDDIARHQFGSGSRHDHPWLIREAVHAEIEHRLDNLPENAVVIRSAPGALERRALAERITADRVIVLAVPADEAKRRAEADRRPEWTANAIDRWWQRYQPHPADETDPSN